MNNVVPPTGLIRGHLYLHWLDPMRYSVLERQYIAARVTRTFDSPEKILGDSVNHLEFWCKNRFERVSDAPGSLPEVMELWLQTVILDRFHDSVLEFAGQEFAIWCRGVSLVTLRDIDRMRLFSYEEYTTRCLSENLATHTSELRGIIGDYDLRRYLTWEQCKFLETLFYVHPMRENDSGKKDVEDHLIRCASQLLYYLNNVGRSDRGDASDIYRDDIPWALRTPFILSANQRALGEAASKRTCYDCGHREYVDFWRAVVDLIGPHCPLLRPLTHRHCPMDRPDITCCRTKWASKQTQQPPPQSDSP